MTYDYDLFKADDDREWLNPRQVSPDVMAQTWGHLAPEPGRKYHGYIIVAKGIGGNNIIFDYGFDGLPDSPWFAEDMDEFAFDRTSHLDSPALYRWDGWYKKFRTGSYRFGGGKFRQSDAPQPPAAGQGGE